MNYSIRMLKTAQIDVPAPEVYWMESFHQWTTLQFQMGVITGNGKTILVNTGFPEDIRSLAAAWQSFLGEKAVLHRPDDWKTRPALESIGIKPAAVDYVIVTPIQLYATGNLDMFPNAKICVSRKGWIEDIIAPSYPHHVPRNNCIMDKDLFWLLGPNAHNLILMDDVHELLPGLTCRWGGAHHRSSMIVEVATAKGCVMLSDCAFHFKNVEEGKPIGIAESIIEAHQAYEHIRQKAKLFVPLYDPLVQVRYPKGIVA